MSKCTCAISRCRGFSLLELVAVVTLIGIVAAVTMLRMSGSDADNIKKNACDVNKGNINLQVRLWRRSKGSWPANDLSDVAADRRFFPKGLPRCPVDGAAYTLDGSTHEVRGHNHQVSSSQTGGGSYGDAGGTTGGDAGGSSNGNGSGGSGDSGGNTF